MSDRVQTLINELLRSRETQDQILAALNAPGQRQQLSVAIAAITDNTIALAGPSGIQSRCRTFELAPSAAFNTNIAAQAGSSGIQARRRTYELQQSAAYNSNIAAEGGPLGQGHEVLASDTNNSNPVATLSGARFRYTSENELNEMSRIFNRGSWSNTQRKRLRRSSHVSLLDATFIADIYLLEDPGCSTTYRGTKKVDAYQKGLVISSVSFIKHWTRDQICNHVRQLFPSILPANVDLEFLLPVQGYLIPPNLPPGASFDGFYLSKVFGQRPVYVRPSCTILNQDFESDTRQAGTITTLPTSVIVNVDDDEEGVKTALECNNKPSDDNASENIPIISLNDILRNLQMQITEDISQFNIYRKEIFHCCIRAMRRKSFSPFNKISVKFSDFNGNSEGAVDVGGPTPEMFRLVLNYISNSKLFIGNQKKNICLERVALEKKEYFEAGRLIIVHGGPSPNFFSDTLYHYITVGIEKTKPSLNDVDEEIRQKIVKVINCNNLNELQEAISEEPIFAFAGCYIITDMQEKQNIIEDTLKFYVLHRTRPALDQFIEGLQTCNIYNLVVEYPTIFKGLMCCESTPLTADVVEKLFKITLSDNGTNRRQTENRLLAFWRDYLQDCEERAVETTLEEILCFVTGADKIPPLGFDIEPTIHFLHDSNIFPKANTCALEIHLPTCHSIYEEFREKLNYGIREGMVFGFA